MYQGDAKPFSELLNLFGVIEDIEEPQYEAMRHNLDLASKTINKLLVHKSVKGTPIQNALKQLATGVRKKPRRPSSRKKSSTRNQEIGRTSLIEVDISVSARGFLQRSESAAPNSK